MPCWRLLQQSTAKKDKLPTLNELWILSDFFRLVWIICEQFWVICELFCVICEPFGFWVICDILCVRKEWFSTSNCSARTRVETRKEFGRIRRRDLKMSVWWTWLWRLITAGGNVSSPPPRSFTIITPPPRYSIDLPLDTLSSIPFLPSPFPSFS